MTTDAAPQPVLPDGRSHAGDELLTTVEVAAILRVPVSTVRYWRHMRTGPPSFRLGRRVVYWRSAVDRWLADQESTECGPRNGVAPTDHARATGDRRAESLGSWVSRRAGGLDHRRLERRYIAVRALPRLRRSE